MEEYLLDGYVGGIIGRNHMGEIMECVFTGYIDAAEIKAKAARPCIGKIVGYNNGAVPTACSLAGDTNYNALTAQQKTYCTNGAVGYDASASTSSVQAVSLSDPWSIPMIAAVPKYNQIIKEEDTL